MASISDIYGHGHTDKPELDSNFGVDYAIHYRVPSTERDAAEAAFVTLIEALAGAGFATEVRPGADQTSLLIFVKIASDRLLRTEIHRARLQDYLYGIRASAPPSALGGGDGLDAYFADEPISEAERLRLAYRLLTASRAEGGAGVAVQAGATDALSVSLPSTNKYIAALFPLHDHAFNRAWIKKWSTQSTLDKGDLDAIRDKFGERVAFYFAFLQSYFSFLLFPATFGLLAWLALGQFSPFYAVVNSLWSVVFFEYWKKKEVDLAVQWGVRGASQLQLPRPQFQYEREARDPVTGETVKVYSPFRRLRVQLLQVPFALTCVAALGGLIGLCFSIEIFITELYRGPFKHYLTFLPTVLLTVFMPMLTGVLTSVAERLTVLENYETQDAHQAAFVQKIFVINFITSYLPIFLTAFVYVPFGNVLVPYLDVFQITAHHLTGSGATSKAADAAAAQRATFRINPNRLKQQVIYFTVTAQIVNFATEVIVPYAKRKVFKVVKDVSDEIAHRGAHGTGTIKDAPEEAAFLKRVRAEAALDVYDVTIDYREMVVQFGYLSLFSVVWPVTACSFLANNWVEARSDAMKIAISSQRPIPWRGDSIGPWLTSLGFLSWLGSLTSAAIVYLFRVATSRGGPAAEDDAPAGMNICAWALLLSILLAEHLYLVVQMVVRYVVDKMDSPGLQKERAERFALRKRVLTEALDTTSIGLDVHGCGEVGAGDEDTLARGKGLPEDLFWLRQRGASASIKAGQTLISTFTDNAIASTDNEKVVPSAM